MMMMMKMMIIIITLLTLHITLHKIILSCITYYKDTKDSLLKNLNPLLTTIDNCMTT